MVALVLVWPDPVLVNDYECAKEVYNEDLEVPELLQIDQASHQDQDSHLGKERFQKCWAPFFVF